jgi:hypothetical protein
MPQKIMQQKIQAHLLGNKITWKQPTAFVVATAISTVLAIYAVVLGPSFLGVSGLYIAAAVYVPLALWFGLWGCLAGYVSCFIMAIFIGYSLPFAVIWSLADFFEGFIALMIYRQIKINPELQLKKPAITNGLNLLLLADFAFSAYALVNGLTNIFIGSFIAAIGLLIVQAVIEDRKTWLTWLFVGVFVASLVSGIFGVGAMYMFGLVSNSIFGMVFASWVFGDIIVLATLGTIITVMLTPYIVKSGAYVQKYFS